MVPTTTDPVDVDALVRAWFPYTSLATDGHADLPGVGVLTGPVELSMEDAVGADVPTPWTVAYDLHVSATRERSKPARRPDGLHRAFPHGLPTGAELQALDFLLALARRLGGGVRAAGGAELLLPDPAGAVDFRVISPRWLRAADVATLAGNEDGEGVAVVVDGVSLPSGAPAPPDGTPFDVRLSLGPAGAVSVRARVSESPEPAVAGEAFATAATAVYDVVWQSPDPTWRFAETLDGIALACRERARGPIESIARTLAELGSGVVVDADGFPVDRYHL